MEDTRSSTPEAPPEDLWLSILDSVSTSRSIPAKNVIILGEPSTGKSTLAAALLRKPLPVASADASQPENHLDFSLGYDWADVKDDADEGECLFGCYAKKTNICRHIGAFIGV
jgi:dynein light intermediate chain 1, cytosolic